MRALLSTIGSRGDVQPLAALGLALRALGHDVRLCVPPDFRAWLEDLGFDVVPIGPEVRRASVGAGMPPPTPEQVRAMIDGTVATQFDTLTTAARGCDIILGATALQVAARSIAEVKGIPYVFAAYCPRVLPSRHHAPLPLPGTVTPPPGTSHEELWARDAQRFTATFGGALNAQRVTRGLAAIDDVRSYMFTEQPWLAADAVLGPWPEIDAGRVWQAGAWLLPDDRPLPATIESFLADGAPPVYVGFGSTRMPPDAGTGAIAAARALGRRVLLSGGWADLSLADAGRDCLLVDDVNLRALFGRVAAAVHHGGAGTTTLAALAGTPQGVVPRMYDQHYWAARVRQLGLGDMHDPGTLTAESLTALLARVLDPAVISRAKAVASEIRTDGALEAARRLIVFAR